MQDSNFHTHILALLDGLETLIGVRLDLRLTGHSIADAMHINIDPGLSGVVRTERRIAPRMQVDVRDLVQVTPPVDSDNLFITFDASSAGFRGWNTDTFGIHLTRLTAPPADLLAGIFISGAEVNSTYRQIVFLRTPSGDAQLAATGALTGLDAAGRLVAYQTFQFNPGLSVTYHPPSRLQHADPTVMLYIFLTLSVFQDVHQGETPLRRVDQNTVVIGE